MACTQTSRLGAKFGINVLRVDLGPFCVPMAPFSTKKSSLVFGGLILIAQLLNPFTTLMLAYMMVHPAKMPVLTQVQVLLKVVVLLMYEMRHLLHLPEGRHNPPGDLILQPNLLHQNPLNL